MLVGKSKSDKDNGAGDFCEVIRNKLVCETTNDPARVLLMRTIASQKHDARGESSKDCNDFFLVPWP
ncbi:unnamed protein product [Peronospora belbahrii]|uniref:Uncharacterized protein n=1 Tax=Peronospora belbahrii TaxID=622444 RepID=A0ABN8CU65_9STRA|nr:unnamed protein product [Peronospora belbahrii]